MVGRGHRRPARQPLLVAMAALLGPLLYLAWSWAGGHVGFPLDDAWIHQTYARNLAETGQWAFVPGQPSAGSTAPLWTLLLAVGYALHLPCCLWTYALGALSLVGVASLAARLADAVFRVACCVLPVPSSGLGSPTSTLHPPTSPPGLLTSIACAVEWHLVWAAVSGMETLLFALLALALWVRVVGNPTRRPFLTGLLGGLLILTRPEGVLAVGLAAGGVFLTEGTQGRWRRGLAAGASLAAGALLLVAPYLALNFRLSGSPWPNTFYAKQAEYAVLLSQSLLARLWQIGTLPLIGGQVLLLPALAAALVWVARRTVRERSEQALTAWLPLLWAAGTVALYALRLPVTYQHGRYLIPLIPVLIVYGLVGLQGLNRRVTKRPKAETWNLIYRVWRLSLVVLFLAFWRLGAQAYRTDVTIIEEEMVATARWLESHTAPDDLLAVHDIGAVGYFARRPLLDLAGLVNPEVVGFIRDEERLLDWIEQQGADYLIAFPSWYPQITADPRLTPVYRATSAVTVAQGGENMVVYAIRR